MSEEGEKKRKKRKRGMEWRRARGVMCDLCMAGTWHNFAIINYPFIHYPGGEEMMLCCSVFGVVMSGRWILYWTVNRCFTLFQCTHLIHF